MAELLTKFINILKLSTRSIVVIAISTGIIIFAPDNLIEKLGLSLFREQGKFYLGAIFVFSSTIILSILTEVAWNKIREEKRNWRHKRQIINRLKVLTPEEKKILARYIKDKTRSQLVSISDGVAIGLGKNIMYQSSNMGTIDGYFTHNITEFAWEYLNKNSHLLKPHI